MLVNLGSWLPVQITTPTVVMTGELDLRTPMPQSEELYTALLMRGVPAALVRFEGEFHGTGSKPSNFMRTQLYMMSWYKRWADSARTNAGGGLVAISLPLSTNQFLPSTRRGLSRALGPRCRGTPANQGLL